MRNRLGCVNCNPQFSRTLAIATCIVHVLKLCFRLYDKCTLVFFCAYVSFTGSMT